MASDRQRGTTQGLLAAALFGLSAPLSKVLLGSVPPELLAGLLYAGAALALRGSGYLIPRDREARLQGTDAPMMAAVVLTGGVLAPVAMLTGLDRTSAVAGSLLLNLEAPFTILLALIVFGEYLDRRSQAASGLIIGGAVLLSVGPGAVRADAIGAGLIAVACGLWALDNNLTQRLSGRDPFAIVRTKATIAAMANVSLAMLRGATWPSARTLAAALSLGAAAYGVSIVLDAFALRHLGAAREAALFATGPFFGAIAAVPILDESFGAASLVASVAMAAGITLLLRTRHEHRHTHDPVIHEHRHRHDDLHHPHEHDPPVDGWHSHPHEHTPVTHIHPHDSDLHHRHRHQG